jgi:hypothetical protein
LRAGINPRPSFFICPELRLDAELIDGLDDAAEVMAEHLAKHFVGLRDGRLASQPLAKLSLNHGERSLHVRAFVVVLHEILLVVLIPKKEPLPHRAAASVRRRRVLAKGDVRRAAVDENKVQVLLGGIGFVRGHLADLKVPRGRLNERPELRAIARVRVANFNRGDDVRVDARHQVNLHPGTGGVRAKNPTP